METPNPPPHVAQATEMTAKLERLRAVVRGVRAVLPGTGEVRANGEGEVCYPSDRVGRLVDAVAALQPGDLGRE